MSDTSYEVPDAVADALDEGRPSVGAFRQFSGHSRHDVAVEAGMTKERLAEIAKVLDVPEDLLVDE